MIDFTRFFHALFGYRLITNSAGFRVVLGSKKPGPWVKNGDSVALVPTGIQEAQFPVELLGKDKIPALGQVAVQYVFASGAEEKFNFAYDVQKSEPSGDFSDQAKSLVMSLFIPGLKSLIAGKDIPESVSIAEFLGFQMLKASAKDFGLDLVSASCAIRPLEGKVLQALGATQSEALVDVAQAARHSTQLAEIIRTAERRNKDHEQKLLAQAQALELAVKNEAVAVAEATANAAAMAVMATQDAAGLKEKIAAFGDNSVAFALHAISASASNVTISPELVAAITSAAKQGK